MTRSLAARILLGLATTLFVTGCTVGFVGLHPAVRRPTLSRLGILLALGSLPPWMTVMQIQTRQLTEAQLRDARLSGYETALTQMRQCPDMHPDFTVRVPAQGRPVRRTWKRGS